MEGLLCIEEIYSSMNISWALLRFANYRLLFIIILLVAGEDLIARIITNHSSLLLHFVPWYHTTICLIQYGHSCVFLWLYLYLTALLP